MVKFNCRATQSFSSARNVPNLAAQIGFRIFAEAKARWLQL